VSHTPVLENKALTAFTQKEKNGEQKKEVSVANVPLSPYKLVYESLASQPWKVVMAAHLLENISSVQGNCFIIDFFEKFPTLSSISLANLKWHFQVHYFSFVHIFHPIYFICFYKVNL